MAMIAITTSSSMSVKPLALANLFIELSPRTETDKVPKRSDDESLRRNNAHVKQQPIVCPHNKGARERQQR
jgi:hypothetical protein